MQQIDQIDPALFAYAPGVLKEPQGDWTVGPGSAPVPSMKPRPPVTSKWPRTAVASSAATSSANAFAAMMNQSRENGDTSARDNGDICHACKSTEMY